MLRNVRPYRIKAICLLVMSISLMGALGSVLSGCSLDRQVFLESGSYVPVPNTGATGSIKILEVDRQDRQATFYMEDGDTVVVSFSPRDRSDWSSGCPTNIGSSYMEVLDISEGRLITGGLTFENPILVRDCPAEPDRIALRNDGPVGGSGGACAGTDNCLRFDRQLEAAPILTARMVATKKDSPSTTAEPEDGRLPEVELEATLQLPDTLPDGDVVKLNFSLSNKSEFPVYVLKWFTPLEGIGGEIFRVKRDGQVVPYRGILASRGDPTPEAYILLAAGETVSAEVDLAEAYDFSDAGIYTIEFIEPKISHVTRTEAEMARTMEELGPIDMPANVVTVKIGAGDSANETAEEALIHYFDLLSEGKYADALELHGAGYEVLREWNPTVDPGDLTGLLKFGCTVNGLICLPVKTIEARIEARSETGDDQQIYEFSVQFENPDGSLLTTTPEGGPPRSLFDYTVMAVGDGYVVRELPVYVP